VALDVAQKARVDIAMQVGIASVEVVVEGTSVAQVERRLRIWPVPSAARNFSASIEWAQFCPAYYARPGVSNQSGQDEAQVGVSGNVAFSVNGGRTEYNNWNSTAATTWTTAAHYAERLSQSRRDCGSQGADL